MAARVPEGLHPETIQRWIPGFETLALKVCRRQTVRSRGRQERDPPAASLPAVLQKEVRETLCQEANHRSAQPGETFWMDHLWEDRRQTALESVIDHLRQVPDPMEVALKAAGYPAVPREERVPHLQLIRFGNSDKPKLNVPFKTHKELVKNDSRVFRQRVSVGKPSWQRTERPNRLVESSWKPRFVNGRIRLAARPPTASNRMRGDEQKLQGSLLNAIDQELRNQVLNRAPPVFHDRNRNLNRPGQQPLDHPAAVGRRFDPIPIGQPSADRQPVDRLSPARQ